MSQAYYHGKDKYSEWRRCDPVPSKDVPLHLYLSVLGMPGMTPIQDCFKLVHNLARRLSCHASGAVGSVVGQIAKIKGAKVVGIAVVSRKQHI